MILPFLLPIIESIVNRALQSDPNAVANLSRLQNQVIAVHCTDWKMRFFILCNQGELQFEKKYSGQVHTTVSGTLNNFLHIFIKGADTKTVFQYPIDIGGNTQNVEILRDTFKNIDLDLEEKLSHLIGDSLAHKIFFHATEVKKTVENTTEKLTNQMKEYIHFEAKNLPTRKQVEKLYDDIAILRDDVERAEQRLKFLSNYKS